jgi:hypothetical protein
MSMMERASALVLESVVLVSVEPVASRSTSLNLNPTRKRLPLYAARNRHSPYCTHMPRT